MWGGAVVLAGGTTAIAPRTGEPIETQRQKIVHPWLGNMLRCREVNTNRHTCAEDASGYSAEGEINFETLYIEEDISEGRTRSDLQRHTGNVCTRGDVKAKLNQYELVTSAAGLCVLGMQNGWSQKEKRCERHRQLDNMKVGVNICIIKNPGDSLVMPEVETRPIDFAKSEIQSRMQNRQYERQKKGIKRP
ncbi:hypothetical protein B0H14DRAFT_2591314 [Mycena olivaceomarginata]|nr:hypothetical protein B0H14DRAFT_2591314 [Mycena olivaceomarginata]